MAKAVPDPWAFLARELPDVHLIRKPIAEPGRYYDGERAIVLRRGLLLEQERRYLWHEIVHALRRDSSCTGFMAGKMERAVEKEAARRAMPPSVLLAGARASIDFHDLVWRMKVPENWVRFRIDIAHPSERQRLDEACEWVESA